MVEASTQYLDIASTVAENLEEGDKSSIDEGCKTRDARGPQTGFSRDGMEELMYENDGRPTYPGGLTETQLDVIKANKPASAPSRGWLPLAKDRMALYQKMRDSAGGVTDLFLNKVIKSMSLLG